MGFDWKVLLVPLIEAVVKLGFDLIHKLVEQWADSLDEKPTSEEKKQKAMSIATLLHPSLTPEMRSDGIESAHLISELDQKRVAGKTATA